MQNPSHVPTLGSVVGGWYYCRISFKPMGPKKTFSSDRPLKRGRTEVLALTQPQPFAKFLVVHSENPQSTMGELSPFVVAKALNNTIGPKYKAKKMSSGDLLVEVNDAIQTTNLLKMTTIGDNPVSVSTHRSLNTTRGVVSIEELVKLSEADILEGFEGQNIVSVRRIMIRREGNEIPTKHLILTFDTTTLPETVTAGYIICRVRPFVPNPRRCFRCQRFGHGSQVCRGKATCAKCGEPDHLSDNCTNDKVHCVNCKGDHPTYSRSCPQWKYEKEVVTLKIKENISFPEARKRLSYLRNVSYAQALRQGATQRLNPPKALQSSKDCSDTHVAPLSQTASASVTTKETAGSTKLPEHPGVTRAPEELMDVSPSTSGCAGRTRNSSLSTTPKEQRHTLEKGKKEKPRITAPKSDDVP